MITKQGRLLALGLALAVCLTPTPRYTQTSYADDAPSLRERQAMRDQERRLNSEAEFTSKICDTQISASIHWSSFNTRGSGLSVVGYCDVALSAIERICREDKSKVKGRLRSLQCGAGEKRAVELTGATLRYAVGPRPGGDDHEFVYRYLKKKL